MRAFHGAAAAGVFATIVRRHPRYGIVAQWLIPLGDVMAFATYQMGSAGIGEHELEEAHQIVVTGSFYELELSPLLEVLLDD